MNKTLLALIMPSVILLHSSLGNAENAPLKVGWIGQMTGSMAKWGAYQAALLALEDVNERGGINGRKLELIFEDGKGSGKDAASAAQKLINVDHVRYIVGGHCTPESLAIAPIAEKAGVVMLASITSNPYLTTAGDNVFRLTAVSTVGAEKVFEYAVNEKNYKSFAIIYEESDYPRPQAEKFKSLVLSSPSLSLTAFQGLLPAETDFRSTLAKIKAYKPDALYLATLSPDFVIALVRQIKELGLETALLGNENTGYSVNSAGEAKSAFEGLISAAPAYDPAQPKAKRFVEKFKARYNVPALPYGVYTAEAYDSVMLLAELIERCGDEVDAVKKCMYETKDHEGASGRFSIDGNGDALRGYQILRVTQGQPKPIAAAK